MASAKSSPDTREAILDAATRQFAARGFDGTPLQAVADDVGIRKQSLLYHFPTKVQLREAVLNRLISRWNEVLPRLMRTTAEGYELFDAIVAEVEAFFSADPDRARLVVRELLDRPDQMSARLLGELQPILFLIGKVLRTGQDSGLVRKDVDPEAYVAIIAFMLVSGVAVDRVATPLLNTPDDQSRTIRELFRIARASLFTS